MLYHFGVVEIKINIRHCLTAKTYRNLIFSTCYAILKAHLRISLFTDNLITSYTIIQTVTSLFYIIKYIPTKPRPQFRVSITPYSFFMISLLGFKYYKMNYLRFTIHSVIPVPLLINFNMQKPKSNRKTIFLKHFNDSQ